MRIELSALVEPDIEEIVDYIAADSPASAKRMALRIRKAIEQLAHWPASYLSRSDLRAGLHQATVGQYVILFSIHLEAVYVERVLHGRRNLQTHF